MTIILLLTAFRWSAEKNQTLVSTNERTIPNRAAEDPVQQSHHH